MSARRDELVAILDELDTALASTAAALEASRTETRTYREHVAAGHPMGEAFDAITVPENMAVVARELKNLERVRHRTRTAVFRIALDEDMSIGELARRYGFSRQLAQRFAHEAREGSEGDAPGKNPSDGADCSDPHGVAR